MLAVSLVPLLLAVSTLAAEPSFFGPSLIEPARDAPPAAEVLPPAHTTDLDAEPPLVVCETPESSWLAYAQSTYLGLMHDDGLALPGFYDPFSYQFAYGSAGAQPYRL